MRTDEFDYALPPELIAQAPAPRRDQSRLLVLERATGRLEHRQFPDLRGLLREGDVLVLNDSKVVRAKLRGANARTGGSFDILLVRAVELNTWWTMVRPAKRARCGAEIVLRDRAGGPSEVRAVVLERNEQGHRLLRFEGAANIEHCLERLGEVPLPPYIKRERGAEHSDDAVRYQTVYAREGGSIAAPTAGLHFTEELLAEVRRRGVEVCSVTLHVGLGTFAPVKAEELAQHVMHEEHYAVSAATSATVSRAKREGRRVIAVGTTSVRVLESVAGANEGEVVAGSGWTRIFICPPFQFRMVDGLLTNFHLPRSTLLMLVSAFAAPGEVRGREMVLAAYAEAIRLRYRFYSFGDAMFLV